MFGRKKKETESISMNESYTDNSDIPDEMIQKNYRQPQQQVQQPMQQNQYQNPLQMQPVNYNPMLPSLPQIQTQPIQQSIQQIQPVQQMQRPRTAIIVKSELQDNGEFIYTVVTNYQLSVGYARLEQ